MRPKQPKGQGRKNVLRIRLTDHERQTINAHARATGLETATWARQTLLAERRQVAPAQDWCTPLKYVEAVRRVLGTICLDPCGNPSSIVGAAVEYRLPTDGLAESWDYPTIFVNPPYGKDKDRGTTIADWLERCARASGEVLALIPVATNTRHWKRHVWSCACGICFLADTRLRFGGRQEKGAPMACAMVYWGKDYPRFAKVFLAFGAVQQITHSAQ